MNVVRFLPSILGYVYATRDDSVYVNLFLAGMIVTGVLYHKRGGGVAGYDRPYPHWSARRSLWPHSTHEQPTSVSCDPEVSPVWAPLAAVCRSWPPTS